MIHVIVGNWTKILCLCQNFRRGGYRWVVKKPGVQFCDFSVNISCVEHLTSSWHSDWWQISQTTVLYLLFSALLSLSQFGWGRLSLVSWCYFTLCRYFLKMSLVATYSGRASLMPKQPLVNQLYILNTDRQVTRHISSHPVLYLNLQCLCLGQSHICIAFACLKLWIQAVILNHACTFVVAWFAGAIWGSCFWSCYFLGKAWWK